MSNVSKMSFYVFTSTNCQNRLNNCLWGVFSVKPQTFSFSRDPVLSSCMRLAKGTERHFSPVRFHTAIRIQQGWFCFVVLILMVMKYVCKRGHHLLFFTPMLRLSSPLHLWRESLYTSAPIRVSKVCQRSPGLLQSLASTSSRALGAGG